MKSIKQAIVALLLAALLLAGGLSLALSDPQYEYEYTVKAEQVNENEMVNESEDFDTITDEEREMVFSAFKKTDHFLGGSSVELTYDEPVDNIEQDEWKVIRAKGVPILIAISGPDKEELMDGSGFVGGMLISAGLFPAIYGISTIAISINERLRRWANHD